VKFLQHRVADRRVLRLIQKWLDAGVMEEGEWKDTERGTPQGSVISPLLANIYLHYVFDLWVDAWPRNTRGATSLGCAMRTTMYLASNTGPKQTASWRNSGNGWQSSDWNYTQTRRAGLSLGGLPNKTGKQRGEGKPETFDFLNFTHIRAKNRNGNYVIKRHTIGKRLRAKLAEIKLQLRHRMHEPVAHTGRWLKSVVQGYFNYYAVPGNTDSLGLFRVRVTRLWRKILIRRSQRHYLNWARMSRLAERWIPSSRVLHPYPEVRF
jgi:RNA-directed DNA polymerase